MENSISQWWRLMDSPTESNENPQLELSKAWEPMCSRCALSPCEGESFQDFFLMETKQSEAEMRRIQVELPYRYVFVVPSIQWNGGLSLLWKEEIDLLFQTCTLHHIDALIIDNSANLWRLTGFYGWPDE